MAKNKQFEWIEISLRGALVLSALFVLLALVGLSAAEYFQWSEEWVKPLIYLFCVFFALRLARYFYFIKNKKAKILISSLGLTILAVVCAFIIFYDQSFLF